jgi:hypothetical protein
MSRVITRGVVMSTAVAVLVAGAVAGSVVVARQRPAALIAGAATAFLEGLEPAQREKATFPLASQERTRWHFIPTEQFPRNGLPIKEMSEVQRQRAHALLQASLSQRGYMTATAIMELEGVLRDIEAAARAARAGGAGRGGGGFVRDPELYFFSIFGEPSTSGGWGLRVEGHHLSMHFAIDNGKVAVASAPIFFGSNPAEVREGPRTGLRVLAAQMDAGRALVDSLDATQRATAIISTTAPNDIATMVAIKVDPLVPAGLAAEQMNPEQRVLLMQLIDIYVSAMLPEVAAARVAEMNEAGLEKIAFAWAGPLEKGQRYHYRVQGPTFVIEHNNTQNNGNHIHSVWRDFDGDFGRDLLAEHLATSDH